MRIKWWCPNLIGLAFGVALLFCPLQLSGGAEHSKVVAIYCAHIHPVSVWQQRSGVWRAIGIPKTVTIGQPSKNNNRARSVPVEYFRWGNPNGLNGICILCRNGGHVLATSLIQYCARAISLRRLRPDFRNGSCSEEKMTVGNHVPGRGFAYILINDVNGQGFSHYWKPGGRIDKLEIYNTHVRSLILLELPFNGGNAILSRLRLLLSNLELRKPLDGFHRSVLVFSLRLAKNFGSLKAHFPKLELSYDGVAQRGDKRSPSRHSYYFLGGMVSLLIGGTLSFYSFWQPESARNLGWYLFALSLSVPFLFFGFYVVLNGLLDQGESINNSGKGIPNIHSDDNVSQKLLTMPYLCNTLIRIGRSNMANVLSIDKQVAIISALAEGSAIRQIERMTGVHRDTIMRLGVRVGHGCTELLDHKMRNLECQRLQFDELWGFIGKKQKHVMPNDSPECGDVWTFCAIDSHTKLVPSFKVGKRDSATANAFVGDVASRLKNRVQVSTDGLAAYVEAVERAFGANVDYAQIVKIWAISLWMPK